jgi:hypothetical protein
MKKMKFFISGAVSAAILSACSTMPREDFVSQPLSNRDIDNLIRNPRIWDGRTVSIKIYPYDMGSSGQTYKVCFEICDRTTAENSPFIIYTREGRFGGYRGDRPAVVVANYSSTCFYRYSYLCPDLHFGQFTEVLGD